jgi:hypothetical protein
VLSATIALNPSEKGLAERCLLVLSRRSAALLGAMLSNVVKDELNYMFTMLGQWEGVDVATAWKVLTLFIGANDVCVACHLERQLDAEEWGDNLRIVLDTIKDTVPRVFVNVVELFNVSKVFEATENVRSPSNALGDVGGPLKDGLRVARSPTARTSITSSSSSVTVPSGSGRTPSASGQEGASLDAMCSEV